ncbi:MAG TPA: YggT family protein [Ktedonobacteraceae bacterium]|nr:YggT family protein [Ktedonobacteraceae bacterium]
MFLNLPENHGIVFALVNYSIGLIALALLIRMFISWMRVDEQRFAFTRFLAKLTDPFITPFRRLIPPVGFFDFSFLLGGFVLITLLILLTQALPDGW